MEPVWKAPSAAKAGAPGRNLSIRPDFEMNSDNEEHEKEDLDPEEYDDGRDSNIDRQVTELSDQFLLQLQKGSQPDWRVWVKKYPELAPQLENRLAMLEAVFRAMHGSSNIKDRPEPPTSAPAEEDVSHFENVDDRTRKTSSGFARRDATLRVRCPHCHNLIQLVTQQVQEVTCRSCGSAVLVDEVASTPNRLNVIPKQIGRFEIKRLLGQGTFGSVYLAKDPSLDREVAIKVPRLGFFSSKEEERRFFREAQSAARLRHPNIVRVHEVSHEIERPFIVSEFIDGRTLSDLIRSGLMSYREIAETMVQICSAVAHAHENNVIHRDLKPSNILIDQQRNAFVSDFGLARRDDVEITMTVDGIVLGTPAYMSPEQASGIHQRVNARSDIYSLGVILYKMLCRELPFKGTKRMLLHQVINEEPRKPTRLDENIPKDLETITLKAMAKSQGERYQRAEDVGQELQRWLRGEPILARPLSPLTRFYRVCRRYPVISSLAGTIALLLIAATISAILVASSQRQLRLLAESNEQAATANKLESDQRLHQIYQQNGFSTLESNELLKSGFWFSKALSLKDDRVSRTRLGLILDQSPKIKSVFVIDSKTETITYNQNGSRLGIGTKNGRVLIFDTASDELILEKTTDGISVFQLQFLQGGKFVAFRSSLNEVQVWDVPAKRLTKTIVHDEPLTTMAVDHTGRLLATGGSRDSTVKIWDAENSSSLPEIDYAGLDIRELRFAPDTAMLLIKTWDYANRSSNEILHFRNLETGESVHQQELARPVQFDISPDGSKLLTVSNKKAAAVWDVVSGQSIGRTLESQRGLEESFFSFDASHVVLNEEGSRFSQWDYRSSNESTGGFEIPFKPWKFVRTASRQVVATNDNRGATRVYRLDFGSEVTSRIGNNTTLSRMVFHPNEHNLAIDNGNGAVLVWDLASSMPDFTEFRHQDDVSDALLIPGTSRCVTAGVDGKAFVWDTSTGKQIGSAMEHDGAILNTAVSANGRLIATAGDNQAARVWDSRNGRPILPALLHAASVRRVEFSPDNNFIVTGCENGTVTCWDVIALNRANPTPVFEVNHGSLITRVKFDSAGSFIVSSGRDGSVRCWDSMTGVLRVGPLEHPDETWDFDLFPDAERIAVACADGNVYVWNLATSRIEQILECQAKPLRVQVNTDGKIVTSDKSGAAMVWSNNTGRFLPEVQLSHDALPNCNFTHYSQPLNLAASAGGRRGSSDSPRFGAVVLWETKRGRALGPPLYHLAPATHVLMDRDAGKVLSCSEDETARLWNLEPMEQPVVDTLRIFNLLSGNQEDSVGHRVPMNPIQLRDEFSSLSVKYPAVFESTRPEMANWRRQFLITKNP